MQAPCSPCGAAAGDAATDASLACACALFAICAVDGYIARKYTFAQYSHPGGRLCKRGA
jgi:hypothetical protein